MHFTESKIKTRDLEIVFRRMTEIFQESSQLTAQCAKFVRYDPKAKGAGLPVSHHLGDKGIKIYIDSTVCKIFLLI